MALTTISDLWTPAVWMQEISERMSKFPALWNSGVVTRSPLIDAAASGPGITTNVPFIKDSSDQDDEIQVENTQPSIGEVVGATLVAPVLNRVAAWSSTALAEAVAGVDPVAAITQIMAERRLKQRQKTLLSLLRGAFGTLNATTCALTSALSAVRKDAYDESGLDATSEQVMSASIFIQACALLAELEDDLAGGALWVHPNVKAGLKTSDLNSFDKASQGAFQIQTYRGIPIFTSESLVRAGNTNGYVYDTYLLVRGIVGYGEKPQAGDTIGVASLSYVEDKQKNNWEIYDRTRFLAALNGLSWTPAGGTPAGQSATNTELATITSAVANWTLGFQTANRVGAVCILTNG